MIAAFLRRPRGAAEFAADAVRVIGLLSVVVAAIRWSPTDAGILAFALPALVLPRFLGARPGFDVMFGLVVLVAAWSNVLDLYRTVPGWDLLVHGVCTGVLGAMVYLLLARLRVAPLLGQKGFRRRIPIIIVPAIGLAASALWEMVEWFGYTFINDAIFVTYADTIGDMALGGVGAVLAGLVVAHVRIERPAGPAGDDEVGDRPLPAS